MRLHAVEFGDGNYRDLASAWWRVYHGEPLNERLLASTGVAVLGPEGPIALTHIYPAMTADLVWVGFTVACPTVSSLVKGKALKLLLEETEALVKRLGYTIVYTGFDAPALQKLCKREGYFQGSTVIEQWKELK